MANTFKEIESSALKLPSRQRARLASRLISSLEKNIDKDVEKRWLEEIDRRNRSLETGKAELVSEIDVMRNARSLLS